MTFEWDEKKNAINKKKHGIDFYEAVRVFLDDKRIEKYDEGNSSPEEERTKVLGLAHKVVVVIYTERHENLRIISARFATKEERDEYYSNYDLR
ncbi:BrnT family toxin [Treponema parvum]|uniref:BrnT family toxin n=1 Tax=Treponema parvum TaxID=138851 RepID=A0A975IF50_9SPIR|nr:BrnT family toxin [Treponema parvum]QTQ11217.1 BrnT family toxin [Treponema parvum]QTQ14611.1 BrnT family toxin [Treponema parvum]QTQ16850.1 BrnT family toxin [Treponema parvum]